MVISPYASQLVGLTSACQCPSLVVPEESIHRDRSAGSQRTSFSRTGVRRVGVGVAHEVGDVYDRHTRAGSSETKLCRSSLGVQAIRSIPACRVVPLALVGEPGV